MRDLRQLPRSCGSFGRRRCESRQALHVASTAERRHRPLTVDGMNFVELEAKAVRQWETIEARRRALVPRTFSATALRTA